MKNLWSKVVTFVAVAVTANGVVAQVDTLSDPETWSSDVMRGAAPSPECQTDTIENLKQRMAVTGPYTVEEYERTVAFYSSTAENPTERIATLNEVSEFVRREIGAEDRIYGFQFMTDPASGDFWGFTGYLVARGECMIHVEVTSHIN